MLLYGKPMLSPKFLKALAGAGFYVLWVLFRHFNAFPKDGDCWLCSAAVGFGFWGRSDVGIGLFPGVRGRPKPQTPMPRRRDGLR